MTTQREREARMREKAAGRKDDHLRGENLGDMADIHYGPPLPGYEPVNPFWTEDNMDREINRPAPRPTRSRYEALERHGFRRAWRRLG